LLVVGEGDSEVLFLRHLVSLYQRRGSGLRITIKNARGKGAAHVVDVAIRQARNADYDERAVLLDTDMGWNEATEKLARKSKIQVLTSTPCFESVLLEIHQRPVENRTSAQLKSAFAAEFGRSASDPSVFAQQFRSPRLEEARLRVPVLDQLMTLLETGQRSKT
jgi:hypothetical protein